MRFQATLLLIFVVASLSSAQLKITLQFDSAGKRDVFVASAAPKDPPQSAVSATGKTLEYNLGAFGGDDRLYVWDRQTNNIASKPLKEISGSWAVKPSDYAMIGLFTVRVEHKGQALQTAKITVSGKAKSEERLLEPSSNGEAHFFGYPLGDLKVKVGYNTVDKKEGSQEQIFPEGTGRSKAEPVLLVAVPDEVATISESPPAAGQAVPGQKGAGQPGGEEQRKNPVGTILMVVATLVVVGGIAYWLMYTMKNNPKVFEEKLTALGVQVPKQQDPNDVGTPVPVVPLAPSPPPIIVLEDAEPTPLATTAPVAVPPSSASHEPALVREDGSRIALAEGETLVGREDGLGLSLSGESTVSRRHASLKRTGNTVVVDDLGSTNGTFVNGTRLQGETTLRPGDQVQFGSIRFRYEG